MEPMEVCGRVVSYREDAVPDLFVRVEPIDGPAGSVAVYLSETTWAVLCSHRAAKAQYYVDVKGREGGYALTGPAYERAAAWLGVRRRLRAAS